MHHNQVVPLHMMFDRNTFLFGEPASQLQSLPQAYFNNQIKKHKLGGEPLPNILLNPLQALIAYNPLYEHINMSDDESSLYSQCSDANCNDDAP